MLAVIHRQWQSESELFLCGCVCFCAHVVPTHSSTAAAQQQKLHCLQALSEFYQLGDLRFASPPPNMSSPERSRPLHAISTGAGTGKPEELQDSRTHDKEAFGPDGSISHAVASAAQAAVGTRASTPVDDQMAMEDSVQVNASHASPTGDNSFQASTHEQGAAEDTGAVSNAEPSKLQWLLEHVRPIKLLRCARLFVRAVQFLRSAMRLRVCSCLKSFIYEYAASARYSYASKFLQLLLSMHTATAVS